MDVDGESTVPSNITKPAKKEKGATPTGPSSNAPSPKPGRAPKEKDTAPPPLPQGSGLITGALFGVDESSNSANASKSTPNIILHVPLDGSKNQIINFARMAEEKYGFAALHPRLAAQRERLARVAAAGAALEKNEKGGKGGSAIDSAEEDLSLDAERDSDADGDIAMGGTGTGAGTNGAGSEADMGLTADGKKKRTRKKKIEDYDRDDPFVDDSELAWQEQAAASKDGFFVYSGPLVPEGEKVQVERYVHGCIITQVKLLLLTWSSFATTAPMEPSNVAVAVAEELVERVVLHIRSRSRPVFLSPPILDFPSEDQDRVEAACHGSRGLASLAHKVSKTNQHAARLERTKERAVEVPVEVVGTLVVVADGRCPPLLRCLAWWIWLRLRVLTLPLLLLVRCLDRVSCCANVGRKLCLHQSVSLPHSSRFKELLGHLCRLRTGWLHCLFSTRFHFCPGFYSYLLYSYVDYMEAGSTKVI